MTPAPVVPALCDVGMDWLVGGLMVPERKALKEIVENGDILFIDGYAYLLAPVCPQIVDTLAAFGAEAEDRESDLCDEQSEDLEDDKSDYELEPEEDPLVCGRPSRADQAIIAKARARYEAENPKPRIARIAEVGAGSLLEWHTPKAERAKLR